MILKKEEKKIALPTNSSFKLVYDLCLNDRK